MILDHHASTWARMLPCSFAHALLGQTDIPNGTSTGWAPTQVGHPPELGWVPVGWVTTPDGSKAPRYTAQGSVGPLPACVQSASSMQRAPTDESSVTTSAVHLQCEFCIARCSTSMLLSPANCSASTLAQCCWQHCALPYTTLRMHIKTPSSV